MKPESSALIAQLRKPVVITSLISLAVAMACLIVTKPQRILPPPKVALSFVRFITQSNNLFAMIAFANVGQTEVCLWDSIQLWQAAVETPAGWVTNTAPFASVAGAIIPPTSNRIFTVPLPVSTMRCRITTTYGYSKSRDIPSELRGWIWRSQLVQQGPDSIANTISWCLDLLPDPPVPLRGEISTPLLTNSPASHAIAQ